MHDQFQYLASGQVIISRRTKAAWKRPYGG